MNLHVYAIYIDVMLENLNIPKDIAEDFMNHVETIHVKKNSVIVNEGDRIMKIPFVKSGLLSVYKKELDLDREVLVFQIGPGQPCMMSIVASLRGTRSLVFVKAEIDSELILVNSIKMRKWQLESPSWNKFIVNIFMDRYNELLDRIHEITFGNIELRIIKLLKMEFQNNQENKIELTHLAIANKLGTTRVVVSRILKKLEKEKKIKLNRGSIQLSTDVCLSVWGLLARRLGN
jgi:CRP/FNR family transcriptional regulator